MTVTRRLVHLLRSLLRCAATDALLCRVCQAVRENQRLQEKLDAQSTKFTALSDHRATRLADTQAENSVSGNFEREKLERKLQKYKRELQEAKDQIKESRPAMLEQEICVLRKKLMDAEHKITGLNHLTDAVSRLRQELEESQASQEQLRQNLDCAQSQLDAARAQGQNETELSDSSNCTKQVVQAFIKPENVLPGPTDVGQATAGPLERLERAILGMGGWNGSAGVFSSTDECFENSQNEAAKKKMAYLIGIMTKHTEHKAKICRRMIARMLKHQLSQAWSHFVACLDDIWHNRAVVKRVLAKMTHQKLAHAFQGFAEAVDRLHSGREQSMKILARWRTPELRRALDNWVEYVTICREEQSRASQEELKKKLKAAEDAERSTANELQEALKMSALRCEASQERNRRLNICQRAVKRMLKQHLAKVWDALLSSVDQAKRNREKIRRVLIRMKCRDMSTGFYSFRESTSHLIRVKSIYSRVIARMRRNVVLKAWLRWTDMTVIAKNSRFVLQKSMKVWSRTNLAKSVSTWRESTREVLRMSHLRRKAALRMQAILLYKPFNTWRKTVVQLMRTERIISKVVA